MISSASPVFHEVTDLLGKAVDREEDSMSPYVHQNVTTAIQLDN